MICRKLRLGKTQGGQSGDRTCMYTIALSGRDNEWTKQEGSRKLMNSDEQQAALYVIVTATVFAAVFGRYKYIVVTPAVFDIGCYCKGQMGTYITFPSITF